MTLKGFVWKALWSNRLKQRQLDKNSNTELNIHWVILSSRKKPQKSEWSRVIALMAYLDKGYNCSLKKVDWIWELWVGSNLPFTSNRFQAEWSKIAISILNSELCLCLWVEIHPLSFVLLRCCVLMSTTKYRKNFVNLLIRSNNIYSGRNGNIIDANLLSYAGKTPYDLIWRKHQLL